MAEPWIDLSTASTLIALLFVGFGEWLIVASFSRSGQRCIAATNVHWLPGIILTSCGVGLLVLSAAQVFTSDSAVAAVVFWVAVALVAELPVILVLIWYWPQAVRWGLERKTLNPPLPFLAASSVGGIVLAGVIALAVAVVPNLID